LPERGEDLKIADGASATLASAAAPTRGSLRLAVSAASPQVTAGADFSIFVVIQNPFDVPITVHQVKTHIPIEIVDVNGLRQFIVQESTSNTQPAPGFTFKALLGAFRKWLMRRESIRIRHTGVAIAVGTDFDPQTEHDVFRSAITIGTVNAGSVAGIQFTFPENPTTEELDQIFQRLVGYKSGVIPVQLQPGDSVVKQFVLKSRHWLFFTPLTHRFQIQVNFSSDGVDHTDTISYEQTIRSAMAAVAIGSAAGAVVGTLLKALMKVSTSTSSSGLIQFESVFGGGFVAALGVSVLASLAVVVGFARKSAAQPIISVEDFWGGALIGFSTSFFGFDQFLQLFPGNHK
jgi:hypothetical protein